MEVKKSPKATVNVYHHGGWDKVYQIGALFINVINKDYCKSFVVMQKNQDYPVHYHKIKSETFYVLYGELILTIDGKEIRLHPGEMESIERGQDHSFRTEIGVVFEEISTMYMPNDSIYVDEEIARNNYHLRRTTLTQEDWEEVIKDVKG